MQKYIDNNVKYTKKNTHWICRLNRDKQKDSKEVI